MPDTLYDRLSKTVEEIRRNGVGGVRFPSIRMSEVFDEADKDKVVYVNGVSPTAPWEEGDDWNEFSEFDGDGATRAALARLTEAAGPQVYLTFREGCHEAEFSRTAPTYPTYQTLDPAGDAEFCLEAAGILVGKASVPPKPVRRHLDSYDGVVLDDRLEALLTEHDGREEFFDWLDAWLTLNQNATVDGGPELTCVYRLGGSDNQLNPKPFATLTLKVAVDTVHGYDDARNGGFDVSTLSVTIESEAQSPNLSDRIMFLLRFAPQPGTVDQIASALRVKKHRVNSALVHLMIAERVEEMPMNDGTMSNGWVRRGWEFGWKRISEFNQSPG